MATWHKHQFEYFARNITKQNKNSQSFSDFGHKYN